MERKNYLGLGIILAIFAALVSLMCIAFSYADVNDANAEDVVEPEQEAVETEDSGDVEEGLIDEDVNADPVINFKGLSDDHEITIIEKSVKTTTTEKTFTLTGITSDTYSINGWSWGDTKYYIDLTYQDSTGQRILQFDIATIQGNLISATHPTGDISKTISTDVTFSFTPIANPKYYIKVIGRDGMNPLEGVDFWYMSNDGTIFPTVSTVKNAAGTEASAKFEVPADKLNGYYDVSYSKLEPNTVYADDIDTLEFDEFMWDNESKSFVYEHPFDIATQNKPTLLLTSDGNLKYFQIQMSRDGMTYTYCSPRISYKLGQGVPMSATCTVSDGGDVTCSIDNEYVHMSIPCKVFPNDGFVFDRWETGGNSYRAGSSFVIDDVNVLTAGKIYFTNGSSEIAQTGDAIPYAVVVGLGLVAIASFVIARKQFN